MIDFQETASLQSIEEPIEKRIVLDELRRAFDKAYGASQALDGKLQSLLGFMSLVVALSGTLQLTALRNAGGIGFWILLGIGLALYAGIFATVLHAMRAVTRELPITWDWDVLDRLYFGEGENAVLDRIISDHLTALHEFETMNSEKGLLLRRVTTFSFLLVLFVLAATPLSILLVP